MSCESELSQAAIMGKSMNTSLNQSQEFAISVNGLGKCYKIYDNPRDRLKELLSMGKRKCHRKFWAIKGISLEVKLGETVGIIGRNGSGKSTLLQLICGTLTPTVGSLLIRGRVAALLELGSGFNPEFTGKENVYMNASILGLSKQEINDKYDAIVDFADIGHFINQPVKLYSSGMQVRLAFAVAANVDPDILVIDEALSVGDELFQRKCFSRIHSIKEKGATILFVSHSAPAVIELCDRAYLLDKGEAILSGTPKLVVTRYHQFCHASEEKKGELLKEIRLINPSVKPDDSTKQNKKGQPPKIEHPSRKPYYDPGLVPKSTLSYRSKGAKIINPYITTTEGDIVNNLIQREDYLFTYQVDFTKKCYEVSMAMLIKSHTGLELGGAVSSGLTNSIPVIETGSRFRVRFKFKCLLSPGTYFVNAGVEGVSEDSRTYLDRLIDATVFRVQAEKERISTAIVDFCIEPFIEHEKGS
jgi:lipopolysaccharide transport system ATP-binding protein